MGKRIFFIFAGIMAVIGSVGFFVWDRYWDNSEYLARGESARKYIEAMTADSYGGETQQETLDLFIIALNAKDVELASKYFMLDNNLSREKWLRTLTVFKEKGLLDEMAKDVELASVRMELNKYSNLWKIVDFN